MSRAYVARTDEAVPDGMDPLRTCFLDRVALVTAATVVPLRSRALAQRSLADRRGYSPDDLLAIAEIGHHYLQNGGERLALMIFEGLAAVAPREAYYQLALGLAFDRAGDRESAARHYQRATELDAGDGRAHVNLAELALARGDRARALEQLRIAEDKLRRRPDDALARKCRALVVHLGRARRGGVQ